MPDAATLVRRELLDEATSLWVVYGAGVLLFGTALAVLVAYALGWRRRARPRWPAAVALRPGEAVLVGRVVAADARGAFDLERDDGVIVRCEHGGSLLRADGLRGDGGLAPEPSVHASAVRDGQRVCVAGVLHQPASPVAPPGGYRDPAVRWVLRPGAEGGLVLGVGPVASIAARERARRATAWAAWLVPIAVVLHLGALRTFHTLVARGEVVSAAVTGSMTRSARNAPGSASNGDGATVCVLYAEFSDPPRGLYFVEDEVDCGGLRVTTPHAVPFMVARGMRGVYQLGATPRIATWQAVAVLLSLVAATAGLRRVTRRDVPAR